MLFLYFLFLEENVLSSHYQHKDFLLSITFHGHIFEFCLA